MSLERRNPVRRRGRGLGGNVENLTVGEFCRKFGACGEARTWAYGLFPEKSKAMMSQIYPKLAYKPGWLWWTLERDGVMPVMTLHRLSCRMVRETPLADGRKVWDLLTDERSRRAVEVKELWIEGMATDAELVAARDAAWDAAGAAAGAAARAARAAGAAAWAAGDAAWAAGDAAGDAAGAAAWDAQVKIVLEYGNPFEADYEA